MRAAGTLSAVGVLERIEEHIRRSRADRAGRRGALPRLGRARLDVPLPRAARARLPRLGAARELRPARRGVRRGRALLRRGARRDGRAARRARRRARPSCARSATASGPTGCARPATRRATRSRRSSTGSRRAASRKGIKPRREDGVVRPLLPLWREETEAFCRERELRVPHRLVEPRHGARPDPRTRSCRCSSRSIRRRARTSCARSRSAARCRRRSPSCVDSPVGSRRVDLGGGVQAVREHDRLWLERSPVELDGEVQLGRVADPLRAAGAAGPRLAAGRPARRALEEDAGRVRRREGPALRPRGLAARRARRRGRRRARDRRAPDRGGARSVRPRLRGSTEAPA